MADDSTFFWASIHLLFLSNNFAAQYEEYSGIWKRSGLGAIFALGFGIALNSRPEKKESEATVLWVFMYLGLLAPTLIYLAKYFLTHYGTQKGWLVPDYWRLYYASNPFYVPKTAYVCFCLPTMGISLGQLACNITQKKLFQWANLMHLTIFLAVLFLFYAEGIKNGILYSCILFILFLGVLVFNSFCRHWVIKLFILSVILVIGTILIAGNLEKNDYWRSFRADAEIAFNTTQYHQWKYAGERGYPINRLGDVVSVTNYERMAWGKTGLELISQYPLGYGLVERSFGHIAKINWPDSKLHQSHSGWIDLTLGVGVPGISLILLSLLILLCQLASKGNRATCRSKRYQSMAWWALFSLCTMWCTTEISQKIFFDHLIFWLALGSGLSLSGSYALGLKGLNGHKI